VGWNPQPLGPPTQRSRNARWRVSREPSKSISELAECDGHHEVSDIRMSSVNRFTVQSGTVELTVAAASEGMVRAAWMEKIVSKTDRKTKILDAQRTSEVRELTAAELDSVNGGLPQPSLLGAAGMAVVTAVAEGVVFPSSERG
jgi:hypothetical protein